MHTTSLISVCGALLSVAAAIPLAKRDIVWVTDVVEDIVTVPVTTTIWIRPGQLSPVATSSSIHFGHHNHHTTADNTVPTRQAIQIPPPAVSAPSLAFAAPFPSANAVTAPLAPKPTILTSFPVGPVPTTPTTPVAAVPTTSTIVVAPVPTTSTTPVVLAVPTTTVETAPTSPAVSTPASASPATGGSSGVSGLSSGPATAGKSYTGDLTWYQTGMGACGWTNTASDHIVAVSHVIFDAYSALAGGNPNNNPLCGKYVTITGKDGSPFQAKIVDRCVGCAIGDLDLSEDFFNTVTDNGNGRVPGMNWSFA